MKFQPISFT